jgi:hypothetical protein
MTDTIAEIRARHEAVELALQTTGLRSQEAHADRATLLRALDAMAEENARMKEALQAIVDNAEIGEREADTVFARAALSETGAA